MTDIDKHHDRNYTDLWVSQQQEKERRAEFVKNNCRYCSLDDPGVLKPTLSCNLYDKHRVYVYDNSPSSSSSLCCFDVSRDPNTGWFDINDYDNSIALKLPVCGLVYHKYMGTFEKWWKGIIQTCPDLQVDEYSMNVLTDLFPDLIHEIKSDLLIKTALKE